MIWFLNKIKFDGLKKNNIYWKVGTTQLNHLIARFNSIYSLYRLVGIHIILQYNVKCISIFYTNFTFLYHICWHTPIDQNFFDVLSHCILSVIYSALYSWENHNLYDTNRNIETNTEDKFGTLTFKIEGCTQI